MKKNLSEVIVLIDMSGSMYNLTSDTIGGFNKFVDKQKQLPGKANLTVVFFNSVQYNKWLDSVDLKEVPKLTEEVYRPAEWTPLYDSLGRLINKTGDRLSKIPEKDRPGKVIFVTITDGYENASNEFTEKEIFKMITHQQEKYQWEFIYLGANQDAWAVASKLGYNFANAATWTSNCVGTQAVYADISKRVGSYRTASVLNQ